MEDEARIASTALQHMLGAWAPAYDRKLLPVHFHRHNLAVEFQIQGEGLSVLDWRHNDDITATKYDDDGSGEIDAAELGQLMRAFGQVSDVRIVRFMRFLITYCVAGSG